MVKLPEIKKKISSFLSKEDGKISKENLLKTGLVLGAVGIASAKLVSAGHTNSYSPNCDGVTAEENNGATAHSSSMQMEKQETKVAATHDNCIERHAHHNDHSSHCSSKGCWT